MEDVDFGHHSDDYAEYRPGFPGWFFERLATFRDLVDLEALDLGTGTGQIAIELARRGARVIGVDTAPNQVAAAERVAAAAGVAARCSFRVAAAEVFLAELVDLDHHSDRGRGPGAQVATIREAPAAGQVRSRIRAAT